MFTRKCNRLVAVLALGLLVVVAGHAEANQAELAVSPMKLVHDVNINKIIDENLDAIQSFLSDMDPTDLDDQNFAVTPHIYMNFHSGWLQNLSLLKRAGKCTVKYTDKVLSIDTTFGWDDIVADFRYLLRILLATRKGDIHVQLSQMMIKLVVDLNFETYQVTLRKLDFADTGKINISIEGHLLDQLYNFVIKAATAVLRPLILQTIESRTEDIIKKKVDMLNAILGIHHTKQFTFGNLVNPIPLDNVVY